MGMARLAAVACMLLVTPVFAESIVSYELQIGGDNHAADVRAGTRTGYTAGNPADNQAIAKTAGVLNWAATIAVAGNHSQPGHPSDGLATQGVANFVATVELHQGTADGPLVTDADFYSSIHDGGGVTCATCKGGGGVCAGSAFALSYKLVPSWPGYARVTEAWNNAAPQYAGPFMEVCMWPTVQPGKLLGTGAGYAQWCRGSTCGLGSITTKGVGLAGGLGVVPVIEGQLDISTLPEGTYVLKLVPGTGTNVLRGDVDLTTAPAAGNPQVQAFAVAANQALGDAITFELTTGTVDPCLSDVDPPTIASAVSRKTHGSAGTFDISVLTSSAIECRKNGPTQLVVQFADACLPIKGSGTNGALTVNDVQVLTGLGGVIAINSITGNGNDEITVNLANYTGVPDIVYVAFSGITDKMGNACAQLLCFRILYGDVNATGGINVQDMLSVKNQVNKALTTSNFRNDLDVNGGINVNDMVITKNNLNKTVGSCP